MTNRIPEIVPDLMRGTLESRYSLGQNWAIHADGSMRAADAGSNLPIYTYTSVDARLYGAEFEYRHTLPQWIPGGRLE